MAERLGTTGYMRLERETNKGVPVNSAAGDFALLYEESLNTNGNFVKQQPVYGGKYENYGVVPGQRSHTGDVTILAEPNTCGRFFDMLLTRGASSGSNPTTWPYTASIAANPNSYTVDLSMGNVVARYWGVEASKIGSAWNENELRLKIALSALGSFQGREVASVAAGVVTLKTDYDPNPSKGLVAGDLVRFTLANGTTVDTTVTSITATTVTVGSATGVAAGDFITLRPANPSFNTQATFLWAKTEFRFGATAAAALSATHTPLEQGSDWEVMHNFESDDGAMRSGSFDPAALVRTTVNTSFKAKQFFDTPEAVRRFNSLEKQAVVIRHFAGATNQYELRVTINHIKTDGTVVPDIKPGDINYSELEFISQLDQTDSQGVDVKVLSALTTM